MENVYFRDFELTEELIRAIRVVYNDEESDPATFSLLEEHGFTITRSKEEKAEWMQALREVRKQIYAYDMPKEDIIYEFMKQNMPDSGEYTESAWRILVRKFENEELLQKVYERIQAEEEEVGA